ncbi:MAG: hypothetical protein F4Y20_09720 [Acidobacteria bacterium]|nr:hypothetical protein [Acidobacteriota bacterium]
MSFVACGAAVAGLGALLRELRLALRVSTPRAATPEADRAAAVLAFRLQAVRGVLDEGAAAINSLLEDCGTGDARARTVHEPPGESRVASVGDAGRSPALRAASPSPDVS